MSLIENVHTAASKMFKDELWHLNKSTIVSEGKDQKLYNKQIYIHLGI